MGLAPNHWNLKPDSASLVPISLGFPPFGRRTGHTSVRGGVYFKRNALNLGGDRVLPGDSAAILGALVDARVLRRCLSALETLDPIGANRFRVGLRLRFGPFSTRFSGTLRLEAHPGGPGHWRVIAAGAGPLGGGDAEIHFSLEPIGEETRLRYQLEAHFAGSFAGLARSVVEIKAARHIDRFLDRLAAVLAQG